MRNLISDITIIGKGKGKMCFLVMAIVIAIIVVIIITEKNYKELETKVLKELGFSNWNMIAYYDEYVTVKSRQTLKKYNDIKFFKENREKLTWAENIIKKKIM